MADQREFERIAAAKGNRIHWNEALPPTEEFHLDLNMIDASLDAAIAGLEAVETRPSQQSILAKLKQLRTSGSYADRVEFVFGEGPYYFREDLEWMADMASKSDFRTSKACHRVCELITYPLCRCVCVMLHGVKDCDQYCTDRTRSVCHMFCD